jgi:N-hydroxyarylamine O-acetyltransferase
VTRTGFRGDCERYSEIHSEPPFRFLASERVRGDVWCRNSPNPSNGVAHDVVVVRTEHRRDRPVIHVHTQSLSAITCLQRQISTKPFARRGSRRKGSRRKGAYAGSHGRLHCRSLGLRAVKPEQVDRYLARLGVGREAVSVGALFGLHRAQIERIPYETTWIHLGETRSVDQDESMSHLVDHGRGGYCFHLNGAFAALLGALGYQVTMHIGGVHGEVPDPAAFTNHLVLTVAGLPTEDNPGGTWYLDAGLGDALHEPLPLLAGTYRQGPLEFRLSQPTDGVGDWRLSHDPEGSFAAMSWESRPARIDEFADRHGHLSTSPDSTFVQTVCVQRRDATTITLLRALTLTTITADGKHRVLITERLRWFAVLQDTFHLNFKDATTAQLDRLWQSANDSHQRHQPPNTETSAPPTMHPS